MKRLYYGIHDMEESVWDRNMRKRKKFLKGK